MIKYDLQDCNTCMHKTKYQFCNLLKINTNDINDECMLYAEVDENE